MLLWFTVLLVWEELLMNSNLCCCCSNEADGVNEENKPLLTYGGVAERDMTVTAWGAQPLLARLTRGSWSWSFCYSWWRISLLLRRRVLRCYWTAWVRPLGFCGIFLGEMRRRLQCYWPLMVGINPSHLLKFRIKDCPIL